MGKFGILHIDPKDTVAALTAMYPISKLPKNVHCGYFALADAGIIFELEYLSILYFSGLHFHGGSASTYAPGTVVSLDAHRCILVNYPPSALLDGDSVIAFGGLPDATHFGIGPEFNSETWVCFAFSFLIRLNLVTGLICDLAVAGVPRIRTQLTVVQSCSRILIFNS